MRGVCASAFILNKSRDDAADSREVVPPKAHHHCAWANQTCFDSVVPGRQGKRSSHICTSRGNILAVLWVSYGEDFSIPGYPEESCSPWVHRSMLTIYVWKMFSRFCRITYVTVTKQWYFREKQKCLPYAVNLSSPVQHRLMQIRLLLDN